jgi:hypothetical protein
MNMKKSITLTVLCCTFLAYFFLISISEDKSHYLFIPSSFNQLDIEKSWPQALEVNQLSSRNKNIFSWQIGSQNEDVIDDTPIKFTIVFNESAYSFSGKFNISHEDVGGASTAYGDLYLGKLLVEKIRIRLGLTDTLCPERAKAWRNDGSAIDAECNLSNKHYRTDWAPHANPDDFLKDEDFPPIVIYDLDGDGSAEIILQFWGGNRGGPEYTIYQKDSHGTVRLTAKFSGSSEIRKNGKEIETFWSSSTCDGNVKEIYKSIDGIYMMAEKDEYFIGVNPETKKRDCGSRKSIYNYETKKYDVTVIFDGT